eukprot:jgi/Ulvmu1/1836/UM119_0055.1
MASSSETDDPDDVILLGITRHSPVLPQRLLAAVSTADADALHIFRASVVRRDGPKRWHETAPLPSSLAHGSRANASSDVSTHGASDSAISQALADLCHGRWLSDVAVNTYLAEVWQAVNESMPVYLFSTFFFSQLYSRHVFTSEELDSAPQIDYLAVQRWTRKSLPLQNKDILVIPIHENAVHWCLLIVHIPKRQILYCDSVYENAAYYDARRARRLIKALYLWLVLEAVDKCCEQRVLRKPGPCGTQGSDSICMHGMASSMDNFKSSMHSATMADKSADEGCIEQAVAAVQDLSMKDKLSFFSDAGIADVPGERCDNAGSCFDCYGWHAVLVSNLPVQKDDASCGVYMAAFAELILRGFAPPYEFSQTHIATMRLGMAAIIKGLPNNVHITFASSKDRWVWDTVR